MIDRSIIYLINKFNVEKKIRSEKINIVRNI